MPKVYLEKLGLLKTEQYEKFWFLVSFTSIFKQTLLNSNFVGKVSIFNFVGFNTYNYFDIAYYEHKLLISCIWNVLLCSALAKAY